MSQSQEPVAAPAAPRRDELLREAREWQRQAQECGFYDADKACDLVPRLLAALSVQGAAPQPRARSHSCPECGQLWPKDGNA